MALIEFKDYPSTETPLNAKNLNNNFNELKNNTVTTGYLGDNPDINTLRAVNGTYGIYNCSQAPTTGIGVLEVLAYTSDWVIQRFTDVGNGSMWQRTFTSGTTWTEWVQKY